MDEAEPAMSEAVLRQILSEMGGLKESAAQRLRGEQAIFASLGKINETLANMNRDIGTTKHGLANLDMAIRGDGGKFDQVAEKMKEHTGHLEKHCLELETLKGYVNQIKGGLKSGRAMWAMITFLGVSTITGGIAWISNSAGERRAGELEQKVQRIERNIPGSMVGPR